MNRLKIDIGKDFSRYPAGRFIVDGPFSGERFREDFLLPRLKAGVAVEIILDNTAGYGSSFLEEAFGGMVRRGISKDQILKLVTFITEDFGLENEIQGYIKDEWARRRL